MKEIGRMSKSLLVLSSVLRGRQELSDAGEMVRNKL